MACIGILWAVNCEKNMSVVLGDWLWLVAVELVLVLALVLAVGAAHLRDLSLKPSTVKDARGSNNDMWPSWANVGPLIVRVMIGGQDGQYVFNCDEIKRLHCGLPLIADQRSDVLI